MRLPLSQLEWSMLSLIFFFYFLYYLQRSCSLLHRGLVFMLIDFYFIYS